MTVQENIPVDQMLQSDYLTKANIGGFREVRQIAAIVEKRANFNNWGMNSCLLQAKETKSNP